MKELQAVNIAQKLASFSEQWKPKIIGRYNDNDVLLSKVQGEFVWHSHPETDDFFFIVKGNLTIQLRDGDVHLGPGDLYVVPKGVEHRPVAKEEVHILLLEKIGVPSTGDPATAPKKEKI